MTEAFFEARATACEFISRSISRVTQQNRLISRPTQRIGRRVFHICGSAAKRATGFPAKKTMARPQRRHEMALLHYHGTVIYGDQGVAVAGFELPEPNHATPIPMAASYPGSDRRCARNRGDIIPALHAGASKSKSIDNIISLK
jgi:hypothetical protein